MSEPLGSLPILSSTAASSNDLEPPLPRPALPDLSTLLLALAEHESRALASLLCEERQIRSLLLLVQDPPAAAALQSHAQELCVSILGIIRNWYDAGGGLRLLAPPGPAQAPPIVLSLLVHGLGVSTPATVVSAAPEAPPPAPAIHAEEAEDPAPQHLPEEPPQEPEEFTDNLPEESPPPATVPAEPQISVYTRKTSVVEQSLHRRAPEHGGADSQREPRPDWFAEIRSLMGDMRSSTKNEEEIELILQSANLSFARWPALPRTVQRSLIGNLACRLRHLQDHVGMTGTKMDAAFRSLTRFSKSNQPGWVNGLTRGRGPSAETWLDEALCWWEQLRLASGVFNDTPLHSPEETSIFEKHITEIRGWIQESRVAPDEARGMCVEKARAAIRSARQQGLPLNDARLLKVASELYDLLPEPEFLGLRQAVRDQERVLRETRGDYEPEPIPTEWRWWGQTLGRRAWLLGSDPRESRRLQIERSFGFGALSWFPWDGSPSSGPGIIDRLENGSVDLIILVQASLDLQRARDILKTATEAGVPCAHLEAPAGVTRTRQALERYLQPDPGPLGRP